MFFFEFFEKFGTFFSKICAHSEWYRNLIAGIFEIQTCFLQHRVSIVIGLTKKKTAIRVFFVGIMIFFCQDSRQKDDESRHDFFYE